MIPDFPPPQPAPLEWLSPTAANALLECAYRLAWRLDSRFRKLNRPSPWTELGVVAHAVVEDVGRGLLASATSADEAATLVERAWTEHLATAVSELEQAWTPATTPPPEEWPGYHLVHVRVSRRALRLFQRRGVVHEANGSVQVERGLEDPETGLRGRPDRVEGSPGDRCVVDLKTGIGQEGATDAQLRQLLLYAQLVEADEGAPPTSVAIEEPSGRRWARPITPADIDRAVAEVAEGRSKYEEVSTTSRLEELAAPHPDTCRRCPYRLVCGPYWAELRSDWGHPSVLGMVEETRDAPAGSVVELQAESPADLEGGDWFVSAAPKALAMRGSHLALVDAEFAGSEGQLRWRWATMWRTW
jgi:hypothetical protein